LEITLPNESYSNYYMSTTMLTQASATFVATESGVATVRIVGASYDPVPLTVTVTES
jgi:hypothetical protein